VYKIHPTFPSATVSGNKKQCFGNVAMGWFLWLWRYRRSVSHSWNAFNVKYPDNNFTQ